MASSFSHRIPVLLAAGVVASAVAAAPALATEGPGAPPPGPSLPTGLTPPTFAPFQPATPITPSSASRTIRRVRLAHRSVRRGKRAKLRVSLAAPSRLRIVMTRRPSGKHVRTLNVPARGRSVSVRIPARARGHLLRPGRYRISVVALDGQAGAASAPSKVTLTVRRAARR